MLFLPRLFVFLLLKKIVKWHTDLFSAKAESAVYRKHLKVFPEFSVAWIHLFKTSKRFQKWPGNDKLYSGKHIITPHEAIYHLSCLSVGQTGSVWPQTGQKASRIHTSQFFKVHFTEQWTVNTTAGLIRVVWFCFMNRSWLKKKEHLKSLLNLSKH